jgi:small subunit ribosomal protein S21
MNLNKGSKYMARVNINRQEDLERELKRLKRMCVQEGIFRECRDRRHYLKPSAKKRAERKMAPSRF